MILPLWFIAAILGVVEGLTEFIPVSSTGHMIVVAHFLKFTESLGDPDKAELFEVVIQFGAILAVGFLYRRKLWDALTAKRADTVSGKLRTHLIVAFLPAAVIGFLLHKTITTYLFSPMTISISFIVGGFIIIYVESFISVHRQKTELNSMTMRDALVVGFSQVLSLIPGVSRSGSTIIGGIVGGMKREAATEFSFLLSFPIMIAASGYELFKYRHLLSSDMYATLGMGFIVSFIVALAVVRWLVGYVRKHNFIGFGYYRILFGALILVLWLQGVLQ